MKTQLIALFSLTFAALSVSRLGAMDFSNGDFAHLRAHWGGPADIAYLNADGTITPGDGSQETLGSDDYTPDPDAIKGKSPLLQLDLNPMQFRSVVQKFSVPDSGSLEVEVQFKGSDDLKRSEKRYLFGASVAPGQTIELKEGKKGGGIELPYNDLSIRVQSDGKYFAAAGDYKAGDDWQTIKLHCSGLTKGRQVWLYLFGAPGEGKIFVKSVTAS